MNCKAGSACLCNRVAVSSATVGQGPPALKSAVYVIPTLLEGSRFALYCYVVFNITALDFYFSVVTMFAFVQYRCSSGRVVPPLAAGRSPTDEIKNRRIIIGLLSLNKDI